MLPKSIGVCLALTFILQTGLISTAGAVGVGETCGGVAGIACDAGLWCFVRAGRCGVMDASGTCIRLPEVYNKAFIPVCGCDGKTYGNDCERQQAKAQKNYNGACN